MKPGNREHWLDRFDREREDREDAWQTQDRPAPLTRYSMRELVGEIYRRLQREETVQP